MGFLLFILSTVLSFILYPVAFIVSIVKNFYHAKFKDGLSKLNQQFFDIASSIDATGNVVCDDLFNLVWIKKDGYQFGNRKEPISSALGKNQQQKTLTWAGWIMVFILNAIDKNHCIKSIDYKL